MDGAAVIEAPVTLKASIAISKISSFLHSYRSLPNRSPPSKIAKIEGEQNREDDGEVEALMNEAVAKKNMAELEEKGWGFIYLFIYL